MFLNRSKQTYTSLTLRLAILSKIYHSNETKKNWRDQTECHVRQE